MPKAVDLQPPSENLQMESATQAKFLDNRTVARDVLVCEVVQQLSTLSDQVDQCALGVEIFAVLLQVLGEMSDAEGEHCNLALRRTGVGSTFSVLGEEFLLLFCVEIHVRNRLDVRDANKIEVQRYDRSRPNRHFTPACAASSGQRTVVL